MSCSKGTKRKRGPVIVPCLVCGRPHKRTGRYWYTHPACVSRTTGYQETFSGTRLVQPKSPQG